MKPNSGPGCFLRIFAVLAGFILLQPTLFAAGTPIPPTCGRSIYLAKFEPQTIGVSNGLAVTIPVGILPFVSWSTDSDCARPTRATLDLELTFGADGVTHIFTPATMTLPVPKKPGLQSLDNLVQFTLPADAIPAEFLPIRGVIRGVYTVEFEDSGQGNETISATGDVPIAMVQIEPRIVEVNRELVSQLGVEYLPLDKKGDELFQVIAPGDQAKAHFRISNNHPLLSVSLNAIVDTLQAARLPNGIDAASAYAAGVYSLGNPLPNAEKPAIAFANQLPIGTLLTAPDPEAGNTEPVTQEILLLPGRSTILTVVVRTFGNSAIGSAFEVNLHAEGTFSDESPALGEASTVFVTGDQPPATPGITVQDFVTIDPAHEITWSPLFVFKDGVIVTGLMTFAAGNLPPPDEGQHLVGNGLKEFNEGGFPAAATATIRAPMQFDTLGYFGDLMPEAPQTTPVVRNQVFVDEVGDFDVTTIPFIVPKPARAENSTFMLFVRPASLDITVVEGEQTLFDGKIRDFIFDSHPTFQIQKNTLRILTIIDELDRPWIDARPAGVVLDASGDGTAEAEVTVARIPADPSATWKAKLKLFGVRLGQKSGTFNQKIPYLADIPVLGDLFRSSGLTTVKSKDVLLPYLIPTIVEVSEPVE